MIICSLIIVKSEIENNKTFDLNQIKNALRGLKITYPVTPNHEFNFIIESISMLNDDEKMICLELIKKWE